MKEWWDGILTFQSLIGRLGTNSRARSPESRTPFQSLIGRLGTVAEAVAVPLAQVFQSLIGRLGTMMIFSVLYFALKVSIPHR